MKIDDTPAAVGGSSSRVTGWRRFFLILSVGLFWAGVAGGQQAAVVDDEIVELDPFVAVGIREVLERGLELQREATNFRNVLTSDSIGNLPDKNIADALSRVPGIAIERAKGEGRYVSVRGIEPGLNNVTFEGQTVGASDVRARGGRPPPLELLSAATAGSIEVHKTVTPDMDGHSIGATVNIKQHSAFDREAPSFAFASFSVGTNDLLVNANNLYGGTDIYETQVGWGSRLGELERWGVFIGANYSSRDYMDQQLNTRDYTEVHGVVIGTLQEREIEFGTRERWGLSGNVEFRPTAQTKFYLRSFYTRLNDDYERITAEKRLRPTIVVLTPTSGTATANYQLEGRTINETRETWQFVLGAEHQLNPLWSISASASASEGREVRDEVVHEFKNQRTPGRPDATWDQSIPWRPIIFIPDPNDPRQDLALNPDEYVHSRIRFEPATIPERVWTVQADVTRDLDLYGYGGFLKFGAKYLDREKNVNNDSIRFIPAVGEPQTWSIVDLDMHIPSADRIGPFQGGQHYPSFPTINGAAHTAWFMATGPSWTIDANGLPQAQNNALWRFQNSASWGNSFEDDYNTVEKNWAAYAMADVRPSDQLTVLGGVRVERTKGTHSSNVIVSGGQIGALLPGSNIEFIPDSRTHTVTNWLPNLQARYEVNDQLLLRGAATRSIGRPDYIAMAPLGELVVDIELAPNHYQIGQLEIGNPELDVFESTNLDFEASYLIPHGAVSVGLFYKRIRNPVYTFRETRLDTTYQNINIETLNIRSRRNADTGHVRGVEITYQQSFRFLPGFLDGLGAMANVALISSSVTAPERPNEKFKFFMQPNYVGNAQLFYDRGMVEARLAYRWQDSFLRTLGVSRVGDVFEDKSSFLDFRLGIRLNRNWTLFGEASNLTNEEQRRYVVRPGLPFRNPGFSQIGRTYMVGVSWSQ